MNILMKQFAINLIFYLHVIVFLLFPIGFFIPTTLIPNIIVIHFWYCFGLFILFYAWGLIWTIKYHDKIYAICVLDTIMQKLRGYNIWDKRNYNHSFVEELFMRLHIITIPKRSVPLLLLACIILSALRFLLFTSPSL